MSAITARWLTVMTFRSSPSGGRCSNCAASKRPQFRYPALPRVSFAMRCAQMSNLPTSRACER
eukprot:10158288-Alexandrium_andersonii.AAC.1